MNLKLNKKEIKEVSIYSGLQDVLAAVNNGEMFAFVEVETLSNGHMRGYIESKDGRKWKRGITDLVELSPIRGTTWRLTPHPNQLGKFQIHYDENYWYDQDSHTRRGITSNPYWEPGVSVLEVARIPFSESILMEDEELLWTVE